MPRASQASFRLRQTNGALAPRGENRRGFLLILTACISLFLAAAACHESGADKSEPARGGVLRLPLMEQLVPMDPLLAAPIATQQLRGLIYETLVRQDSANGGLVPLLAESWSCSSDQASYTFVLRKDVYFHDQPELPQRRLLDSAAVRFSVERLVAPSSTAEEKRVMTGLLRGAREFSEGTARGIEGIETPDARTVIFHLSRPYDGFPRLLSMPGLAIVDPSAVKLWGEEGFRDHPTGTGPFRLALWNPPFEVRFRQNGHYWMRDESGERLPYLNEVRLLSISGEGVGSDLLSGRLDAAPTNTLSDGSRSVLRAKGFITKSIAKYNFIGLVFRQGLSPWANHPEWIAALQDCAGALSFTEQYTPAKGFVPPGSPWYDEGCAVKAKKRLPNPPPELHVHLLNRESGLGLRLQNIWAPLGLKVTWTLHGETEYWRDSAAGRYPVCRAGWVADSPTLCALSEPFRSTSPFNAASFSDASFDELWAKARMEQDPGRLRAIACDMQRRVNASGRWLFLWHERYTLTWNEHVKGIESSVNPVMDLDVRRVWIAQ